MSIFEKGKKILLGSARKEKTYLSLFNKTKTLNDDVYDMDGDNGGDAREDVFEEEDGNGAEEGDDEKKRSIEEKIVVC